MGVPVTILKTNHASSCVIDWLSYVSPILCYLHCLETVGELVKHVLINSELGYNLEAMLNLIYSCD